MLREAKDSYSRKVEQKLQENNMKEEWDGMKTITGCKRSSSTVEGDAVRANQFNLFYRFDNPATGVNACLTPGSCSVENILPHPCSKEATPQ